MNIRKAVDYSAMFAALEAAMDADLPQMELYCEIGKAVCEHGQLPALRVTHLRRRGILPADLSAHETVLDLVCRLLLEKKKFWLQWIGGSKLIGFSRPSQ